uniref:Alpha-1,3-glucosyltransferase n=1 Tax=Ornithodoros turicata TaxID=34597 RepID=A0A2R5LMD8_9ACAR
MHNFFSIVLSVTCLKLLFIPAYRSTDFEVHRNWLAITHSLPISKWYYENTSIWTLDYPPLFAWFEYLLSFGAKLADPAMLNISNLDYASSATIIYQRATVILSDFAFVFAVWEWKKLLHKERLAKQTGDPWFEPLTALVMLFLWNPGLLLVDHIHFQYNGFLHGVLLLAAARIFQNRCVEAALWFAVLLNLKHIYLYVAPAFFIYLLRSYCFVPVRRGSTLPLGDFSIKNFVKLGSVVFLVFAVSLGPFVLKGQMGQLVSRLFPFKRGLCHAYWAPNFWALYAAADKALTTLGPKLNLPITAVNSTASMTGGLVQEFGFSVLPDVAPAVTFLLTLVFQLPALWKVWRHPLDVWVFLRALVMCAFSSFLFGWHVHEKAVLIITLTATPLALLGAGDAGIFVLLSAVGHFSLFPLLYKDAETPVKILLLLLHTVYALKVLKKIHRTESVLRKGEVAYLCGMGLVYVYGQLIHARLPFGAKLPFLPLMLISVYCSLGIFYAWFRYWASLYDINFSSQLLVKKRK